MSVVLTGGGAMRKQQSAPASLAEAHEALWRQRPAQDAEPLVWVAFHRCSAEVYARAAKADPEHKTEALQYAGMAIRRARDIEHRLNPQLDDEEI
jgi:hypothetical protein